MANAWDTSFQIIPQPKSAKSQSSPTISSPTDKRPPLFHFNRDDVNFNVPLTSVFFEEKTPADDRLPRHLKIHLLGHEGCEGIFTKYADTVRSIEFSGYFDQVETLFAICSSLKKLTDVRFTVAAPLHLPVKPLRKSSPWIALGNDKITKLKIYVVDIRPYHTQNSEQKKILVNYLETILEYSAKEFPNTNDLTLILPDTDRLICLSKNLIRQSNLPKNIKMEITVDYKIFLRYDALNTQAQQQLPPRRSNSFLLASPDSSEANVSPKCNNFPQNKEDESLTKKSQGQSLRQEIIKAKVEAQIEREPQSPSPPGYSYGVSTAERLLRESAVAEDKKNAAKEARREAEENAAKISNNNKRPGEPIVNPVDAKRPHQETVKGNDAGRQSGTIRAPSCPPSQASTEGMLSDADSESDSHKNADVNNIVVGKKDIEGRSGEGNEMPSSTTKELPIQQGGCRNSNADSNRSNSSSLSPPAPSTSTEKPKGHNVSIIPTHFSNSSRDQGEIRHNSSSGSRGRDDRDQNFSKSFYRREDLKDRTYEDYDDPSHGNRGDYRGGSQRGGGRGRPFRGRGGRGGGKPRRSSHNYDRNF